MSDERERDEGVGDKDEQRSLTGESDQDRRLRPNRSADGSSGGASDAPQGRQSASRQSASKEEPVVRSSARRQSASLALRQSDAASNPALARQSTSLFQTDRLSISRNPLDRQSASRDQLFSQAIDSRLVSRDQTQRQSAARASSPRQSRMDDVQKSKSLIINLNQQDDDEANREEETDVRAIDAQMESAGAADYGNVDRAQSQQAGVTGGKENSPRISAPDPMDKSSLTETSMFSPSTANIDEFNIDQFDDPVDYIEETTSQLTAPNEDQVSARPSAGEGPSSDFAGSSLNRAGEENAGIFFRPNRNADDGEDDGSGATEEEEEYTPDTTTETGENLTDTGDSGVNEDLRDSNEISSGTNEISGGENEISSGNDSLNGANGEEQGADDVEPEEFEAADGDEEEEEEEDDGANIGSNDGRFGSEEYDGRGGSEEYEAAVGAEDDGDGVNDGSDSAGNDGLNYGDGSDSGGNTKSEGISKEEASAADAERNSAAKDDDDDDYSSETLTSRGSEVPAAEASPKPAEENRPAEQGDMFRPARPEGRRADDGEMEEEIAKRREGAPESSASEAGSIRSDRLISYGNDAVNPPRKEMAAGDKKEEKIPDPPNDDEPYIPIHPLLANYLPKAWFKDLMSLDDCMCKTPLFNAIYQLANVIRSKTNEIKEMDIRNENLKQTNSKVVAELRKWSQASSFFEQSQIKLEAELHKTNLQRDDLKKKLEGQTTLLDAFREQLKDKQAQISSEHVTFGDLERELEFTQREVILRDQTIEKLQERVAIVERERGAEAEKRRQASARVTDLESEMVALEAKHAKSNTINEAIAAKQKAEAASRIANENLNALQQEYLRLIHINKNDGDYNTELVQKINKLMAKNESLEKELGQLRCEANCQIINLNTDKNKVNSEYQRLTRERVHLDTVIADLKASNGLLRHEREASKSDLATLRAKLDEVTAEKKDEKIRSNVVVTRLGEELKSLKKKLLVLESKSGNEDLLKQMLEKKGKELAQLQSQTEEKLSLLTSSMKCSTENLHAQIEALKAALLRKAEELQRLKYEHGDTIELEPIGISFQKQVDGTVKVVEGPGVSREAELKNVINEMTKQLEVVRKDNKRLKDLLKSTEDECDCLQNCFKENTRLEKDVEKYRKIIQEIMSQSKSLTRTAKEMGFYLPGHSTRESFIKDKESIKKSLVAGGGAASRTPSRKTSRSGATSRGGGGASGPPSRSGGASGAASQSSFGDGGGESDEEMADDKLVKLDDAVDAAMTARDNQLRSVLRKNMEQMGLDESSILDLQEFQDQNVDYLAELETVFNRAKELADLAEEYRLRVGSLEIECAKTQSELDHYKELELTLIEKGLIDGEYLQKMKADVIDVLKPEPEQIVDMDHFLEEQQQMLREKVAKECSSRSDLVEALKNQFLNEAKELHDELELLRQKLLEKEKELQERGFQRSGYLDQDAKWREEMPPPADAVGYRDNEGAWREASPPPQEPGFYNAGGQWKEEVPNPNVAGFVNDGGNFVQAPLQEPPAAAGWGPIAIDANAKLDLNYGPPPAPSEPQPQPPAPAPAPLEPQPPAPAPVEPQPPARAPSYSAPAPVEPSYDPPPAPAPVEESYEPPPAPRAPSVAEEVAIVRDSGDAAPPSARQSQVQDRSHVSFVGEDSRKNSTVDVEEDEGGEPSARVSTIKEESVRESTRSSAKGAPEEEAEKLSIKSRRETLPVEKEEMAQPVPTTQGGLTVVGGIAMKDQGDEEKDMYEEEEDRRIARMLKKSNQLDALADQKERKEVAMAEEAQRWSANVLQKRLKGAYNCFMSYWESIGGIIPDCDNPCSNTAAAGSVNVGNQNRGSSVSSATTALPVGDENENENRRRRRSGSRRRKSGDRRRSSSQRRSGSRRTGSSRRRSTSQRRSNDERRHNYDQRSTSRNARRPSPGQRNASPNTRRYSIASDGKQQQRQQLLNLQLQLQRQSRRRAPADARERRDRTLTPKRGRADDDLETEVTLTTTSAIESDDGLMTTTTRSRMELRERARDPAKRRAYVRKRVDERIRRMRSTPSDDSDSSGMSGRSGLSRQRYAV